MTQHAERLLADRLVYHRTDGTFTANHVRAGTYPFYVEGERAEGTIKEIVIHDAIIIYREPGSWQPTVKAKTIVYSPGHYLRLASSFVGVGQRDFLPFARFRQDLTKPLGLSYIALDAGHRGSLGAYVDAGLHLPVAPGLAVGPDLGFYTARGVMAGPLAVYDISASDYSAQGSLKSGFIHDYGNKLTDVLGNPVPASRGYVDWEEQAQFGSHFTLNSDINWWKDSEVIRDFRTKGFVGLQEPDNYLEADYTGRNTFLSVFTRFQPDAFFPVQQRLPELQFELVPTAIGGGFYERFEAGLAHLKELPPEQGARLENPLRHLLRIDPADVVWGDVST